jgi:hypothetical protein
VRRRPSLPTLCRFALVLFACAAACVFHATAASAQSTTAQTKATPAPTAEPTPFAKDYEPMLEGRPVETKHYTITASIELGARGVSVDGNDDKYRSDVNYRAGFRVFESSFLIRAKEGFKGSLFDSLLVNSNGFGSDPQGSLRINGEKGRWYRFDANFRRNSYDNLLRNIALGQHTARYKHNFGDFDLYLLPTNRRIRFSLGYSGDRERGPGTTTVSLQGDQYLLNSTFRTRADEVRAGVEGRVGGVNLGFLQGFRWYRTDSSFTSQFNRGTNLTNSAVLNTFRREDPMRGRAAFTRLTATTTFARRVDLTARYTFTHTRAHFLEVENSAGTNSSGNLFNPDLIDFTGETERPAHLGEVGLTWRATRHLRIQETFRFNWFENKGDEVFNELVFTRRPNGTPVTPFPATTNVPISRMLEYRRFHNQLKLDYQWSARFSFHAGWRITDRRILLEGVGRLLPTPVSATATNEERVDTTNHSFFGGFRAKPTKSLTLYFDAEKGEADNTFTRVDNLDQIGLRGRARWTPARGLSVNLNVVTRDSNNPGVGVVDNTIFGTLDSTPFSVDINSRIFGGSLDYAPHARLSLSGGYTNMRLTSDAEILYFAGLSGNRFATGRSQFFLRDQFFYFSAMAELHKRVTGFATYRVNNDAGQGSRITNDAGGLFIRSLPFVFQTPEARLAFKLGRRVDWNIGYQYYAYKEKPPFNTGQDYRAHLPYTSLRVYFGGRE